MGLLWILQYSHFRVCWLSFISAEHNSHNSANMSDSSFCVCVKCLRENNMGDYDFLSVSLVTSLCPLSPGLYHKAVFAGDVSFNLGYSLSQRFSLLSGLCHHGNLCCTSNPLCSGAGYRWLYKIIFTFFMFLYVFFTCSQDPLTPQGLRLKMTFILIHMPWENIKQHISWITQFGLQHDLLVPY